MKKLLQTLLLLLPALAIFAQENLPSDYLTPAFHKGRREAFRNLMPAGSVALILAYPERTFSEDVDYTFHQNPDLYYLTGYNEPDALLILFKDMQGKGDSAYNEVFFVRKRDPFRETWNGRRLGVEGVKSKLGFDRVYEGKDLAAFPLDLGSFTKVISERLPTDIKRSEGASDLSGLIETLKVKGLKALPDDDLLNLKLRVVNRFSYKDMDMMVNYLKRVTSTNSTALADPEISRLMQKPDSATYTSIREKIIAEAKAAEGFDDIVNTLREIKTPEEMGLIRKTARISALAHAEVMKAATPGMSERQAEAIQTYVHKYYGAEGEGYPPISGVGANGCILHYEENSSLRIDNQLLLMDIGAEYHGYSADVTRTIPGNGKFSPEQKAIYQLVFDAQEAVIALCHEGGNFAALEQKAGEVLGAGLVKLGIINNASEVRKYYPHGCSHYIGLDVHDKGHYGSLKANMVITVEPGIYIPANSPCDRKWWNIGVRIEDDVLITKSGHEVLSADAPRTWQDVERKMAEKSGFNGISLPKY